MPFVQKDERFVEALDNLRLGENSKIRLIGSIAVNEEKFLKSTQVLH